MPGRPGRGRRRPHRAGAPGGPAPAGHRIGGAPPAGAGQRGARAGVRAPDAGAGARGVHGAAHRWPRPTGWSGWWPRCSAAPPTIRARARCGWATSAWRDRLRPGPAVDRRLKRPRPPARDGLPGRPAGVRTDTALVHEILSELVANSATFTPRGGRSPSPGVPSRRRRGADRAGHRPGHRGRGAAAGGRAVRPGRGRDGLPRRRPRARRRRCAGGAAGRAPRDRPRPRRAGAPAAPGRAGRRRAAGAEDPEPLVTAGSATSP